MHEYDPFIAQRARQLVHELRSQEGPIDTASWFKFFTFGGGFEMLRDRSNSRGMSYMIETFLNGWCLDAFNPWYRRHFNNFRIRMATERQQRGSSVKDIWYHLVSTTYRRGKYRETKPCFEDCVADSVEALAGATDTTGSLLKCLFWLLVSNSVYYRQLQNELD
ncbi:hypothetical protein B0H10DRAFT_1946133 [Mycena sp. CBHHK59/15]|nr:hypothetical protein B0H10DRAFT_1946133 [Mycena sp. CBHHK59/15]